MSKGTVNKVILIGRLGADPDVHKKPDGNMVTKISVATNHKFKVGDELREETTWHNVVLFGSNARVAAEYLTKGRQVYIEGRLKTNKFTTSEGVDVFKTEIVANEMNLMQ